MFLLLFWACMWFLPNEKFIGFVININPGIASSCCINYDGFLNKNIQVQVLGSRKVLQQKIDTIARSTTSWTTSERLMHFQFSFCVLGAGRLVVYLGLLIQITSRVTLSAIDWPIKAQIKAFLIKVFIFSVRAAPQQKMLIFLIFLVIGNLNNLSTSNLARDSTGLSQLNYS